MGYARVQPGYTLQLQLDDFFLEEESGAPPEEPAIGIRPSTPEMPDISTYNIYVSSYGSSNY